MSTATILAVVLIVAVAGAAIGLILRQAFRDEADAERQAAMLGELATQADDYRPARTVDRYRRKGIV